MARSMFDALMDEEKRGTLANPGSASPLGPTIPMRIGATLNPMLERVQDIFPKDNPYGSFIERLIVGDSPERTGRMAQGIPHQYTGAGPMDPIIRPQIVDLAGALPIGSAATLAKAAVPFVKAAAVPTAMATGAGLLGRALKGKNYAPTSTDDLGAALLGQSLQNTGKLDDAMVTYQGSPHKFDRLDPDKIGTGEGAQSYGHGMYVAENRGVGKGYQEGLSSITGFKINNKTMSIKTESVPHTPGLRRMIPEFRAMSFVEQHGVFEGKAQALSQIRRPDDKKYLNDVLAEIDKLKVVEVEKIQGYLYEIDVPDADIAKMLDWDAPLSEQPESVREVLAAKGLYDFDADALGRTADDFAERVAAGEQVKNAATWMPGNTAWQELTGADFYRAMQTEAPPSRWAMKTPDGNVPMNVSSKAEAIAEAGDSSKVVALREHSPKSASNYLEELGIPGIKYYDQGSRAAGDGTRNMVLFDDLARRAKVLKRNDEIIEQPSVDEFIGKLLED